MDKSKLFNYFLEQSYNDSKIVLDDVINGNGYSCWDYVVVTASNSNQADKYRKLIDYRLAKSLLPKNCIYLVIPDPEGKRVGSGGATLNVLAVLKKEYGLDFHKVKILLIHSGGDSKRIPQYSGVGKLFSPIPRLINGSEPATLFDDTMAMMSVMPSRVQCGVLVMSGDIELLYNPLQVDVGGLEACAISVLASANIGKNHGVFLVGKDRVLDEFLHKKCVAELTSKGAVDKSGNVAIDTGMIYISSTIADSLWSLISNNGACDDKKAELFINDDVRLNFYGDIIYPLSKNATIEHYYEQSGELDISDKLLNVRKHLWECLHGYRLGVSVLSPAKFLHFGTTREFVELMANDIQNYEQLGWTRHTMSNISSSKVGSYCSYVNDVTFKGIAYVENCILRHCEVASGAVLSDIESDGISFPGNMVFSGMKLANGKFVVRFYDIDDNPKNQINTSKIYDFLNKNNKLKPSTSLWSAKIYPECASMQEAVEKSIDIIAGKHITSDNWHSLESSYVAADVDYSLEKKDIIKGKVLTDNIVDDIIAGEDIDDIFFVHKKEFSDKLVDELILKVKGADSAVQLRLNSLLYAAKQINIDEFLTNKEKLVYEMNNFDDQRYMQSLSSKEVFIELPVRINFAGGWTDASPYSNEKGGRVINCACLLGGIRPITVKLIKLPVRKISISIIEDGICEDFISLAALINCSDPFDKFALIKACLVAVGITRKGGHEDLSDVFDVLGGGLNIVVHSINVPRGSGLGTSSIVAAAVLKGLFEIMNVSECDAKLISYKTLQVEQLLTTGGGWQDQIGALVPGVKYITSNSGKQIVETAQLELTESFKDKINSRLFLIFSGQRRLARNILRNIIDKYIANNKESIAVLNATGDLAEQMRDTLTSGDFDKFIDQINSCWDITKKLDSGVTNTCIDMIFETIEDLIDAKMICGAGGGGFLYVIAKEGVTEDMLNDRIVQMFGDLNIVASRVQIDYDNCNQ